MIVFPPCKINLGLRILRKRSDGYHDLETCFFPLPLYDALEAVRDPDPDPSGIRFTQSGILLQVETQTNTCVKAYALLRDRFHDLPAVQMHLHKQVPAGAGLGGGSADGAFSLRLLNEMFRLGLANQELMELAARLGSDCAFFTQDGPALATGRGEVLEPFRIDLSDFSILLVNPGIHIATAAAFAMIRPATPTDRLKELLAKPPQTWRGRVLNDFEEPVFARFPEIRSIAETLYTAGALYASLSGSGSSVYGIFPRKHSNYPVFPAHYFTRILLPDRRPN